MGVIENFKDFWRRQSNYFKVLLVGSLIGRLGGMGGGYRGMMGGGDGPPGGGR